MSISDDELEAFEIAESRRISNTLQTQMHDIISSFRKSTIESVALLVEAEAEPINQNNLVEKIRALKLGNS
jgi:hypothetical protein